MASTLKNLLWPDGQTNPAGIKSKFFALLKSEVAAFPRVPAAPTTPEEAVTLEGDYEMAAGKFAVEIYTTQGVGKVDFEGTGEKDCKGYLNKGAFSYPDISAAAKAFASRFLNSNSIIIAAHYTAGGGVDWVVLGSEDFDAEVSIKGTSGAKFGEKRGLELEVSAPDFHPLPRYTGVITLENGTFDCATNKFTPKP